MSLYRYQADTVVNLKGNILNEDIGINTISSFVPIIKKGCKLPCMESRTFSTADDHMDSMIITLDRASTDKGIVPIGKYKITGFESKKRTKVRITVMFWADKKGIWLTAKDIATGNRLHITKL